jgi:hypothetical protein
MEKPNGAHLMQVILKLWALRGGLGLKKLNYLKVMKANGEKLTQVPWRLWMWRLIHLCQRLWSNIFWNEEDEWFAFDASSPDDVILEEGSLVEDTELSGSNEGKWCITYLSMPEAMPENLWLKTLNFQKAMKANGAQLI